MQARMYLPMYHRFASPDPALDQHFEETQSWNIYSYVQNNPTMKFDPDGMAGIDLKALGAWAKAKATQAGQAVAKGYRSFSNFRERNMNQGWGLGRITNAERPQKLAEIAKTDPIGAAFKGSLAETSDKWAFMPGTISKIGGVSTAFRYVSSGEAAFAEAKGVIPNTTLSGAPKDVFLSPQKFSSAQKAEEALQIGRFNPTGPTTSPTHVITADVSKTSLSYAGSVEGSKNGIEMVTQQTVPVLRVDLLKK